MASISPNTKSALSALAEDDRAQGIRRKFNLNDNRADEFSFNPAGLYVDFSKTHVSEELLDCYSELSVEINFASKRHAFLSGEKINSSEARPALHSLLRDSKNQGIKTADPVYLEQAQLAKVQFQQQYDELIAQLERRSTPFSDILHVGIGGSSLGPQLLFEALVPNSESRKIHFISNIDGHQLSKVLSQCSVESTLVIGVSKTFTTGETLANLDSIADWFAEAGADSPLDNFVGVTANPDEALNYGIPKENIVAFPEWVGGRYSVWSSVSLSVALLLGMPAFDELLSGAADLDKYFYQKDPAENACFIAAALDHYYVNYMAASSRAVFAYDYRLRSLVDYLQQLETESNGKDRQINGEVVDQKTSPVVWGGVGTDVQHSVFQMLHQGTQLIPAEFLLIKQPDHELTGHHTELLANGVAQTAALLAGQSLAEVRDNDKEGALTDLQAMAKVFSGDRPSTTILVEKLSPRTLGALLAFYEHRTFCSGVLTNINSFDQMGVELGKRLAKQLRLRLTEDPIDSVHEFDTSTEQLIKKLRD